MIIPPLIAAWLYFWLRAELKRVPSARTYSPYYNADSWDLDDLFRVFREEADEPLPINEIATNLLSGKKCPRLRTKQAFWLRERWSSAQLCCRDLMQPVIRSDLTVRTLKPDDPIPFLVWLLSEKWETELVHKWILENARSHVFVEDHSFPDAAIDLEIYLKKLENKSR